MKISELIEQLQSIKETDGDIDVKYINDEANCFYYVHCVIVKCDDTGYFVGLD